MAPGIAQGFHQRTQNQLAEQQHKRQMRAAEAARTATAELARDRMLAAKQRNDATIAGAEARNIRSTDSADFRNKRTVAGSLWRTQKQQEGADTRASEARGHSLRTQATGLISKRAPGVAMEFQMAGIDPTTMTKQEQRDMLKAIRAERLKLDTDRDRRNLALARARQTIRSKGKEVDEEGRLSRGFRKTDWNGRLRQVDQLAIKAKVPQSFMGMIAGFSNKKYRQAVVNGSDVMKTLIRETAMHQSDWKIAAQRSPAFQTAFKDWLVILSNSGLVVGKNHSAAAAYALLR